MTQNLLYILTEGSHDAAFLYRILKANGLKREEKKINEYPNYMANFFLKDLSLSDVDSINIQEARSRFMPQYVMVKDSNYVIIYTVGGDTSLKRKELLQRLNDLNEPDQDQIQALPDTTISVLYCLDADDKGYEQRAKEVLEECQEVFKKASFDPVPDFSQFPILEDIKIGLYVFKESETGSGNLEDVIIPLMRQDNDDIFGEAEKFLSIHTSCNLFKEKLSYDESGTVLLKVNKVKYSHKKSLVGTVGQLQKSGMTNTVCIAQTDYLNQEKILANDVCKQIFTTIKQVLV